MDEITIEGKVYISSKQAAKITGYAKDYVGQLCREGRVEARHIGRNWYVLEDAIREHRFGKPEEVKTPVSVQEAPVDRAATWQTPQYVPESPVFVPELAVKAPSSVASAPAIADMQSAWKEWFVDRRTVEALPDGSDDFKDEYLPMIVPEEPSETPEEPIEVNLAPVQPVAEEEEPVFVTRVAEEPVIEDEEVELHRSYDSRSIGEQIPSTSVPIVDLTQPSRAVKKQKKAPKREETDSNAGVTRALLLVIAVSAAIVAAIGTGHAEPFLAGTSFDFGAQKSIVEFLGGTSTYESSL